MSKRHPLLKFAGLICAASLLLSCAACQPASTAPSPTPESYQAHTPLAEIVFSVELPEKSPAGQKIYLEILDEVTGLAFNQQRFEMTAIDERHYALALTPEIGSVVKYRYLREGNPPLVEFTPTGSQVRYRLFHVSGPQTTQDLVSAWIDTPYTGTIGRITGQVMDRDSRIPLPNMLVTTEGISCLSLADGSFLLEGLPPGTHNLVVYPLDGSHLVFQQGAVVGNETTTPALIPMQRTPSVNVTFSVQPPAGFSSSDTLRLIGNSYLLGNTFASLEGGASTIATRAPVMQRQPDGSYSLTISMPVGYALQYKYSFGDGFWNAEITDDADFRLRSLIIPDHDILIRDSIYAFSTSDIKPVKFNVTTPENTPAGDSISIQFNPFGWTPPIPMRRTGVNTWEFTLYGPLHLVANVGYRFCRNDVCLTGNEQAVNDGTIPEASFLPSSSHQTFQVAIRNWALWSPAGGPTTVVTDSAKPRGADFIAGIELADRYDPGWQAYYGTTFQDIRNLNANWTVIDPTQTWTRINPPVVQSVSGRDPSWFDAMLMIYQAQSAGLKVALYPRTTMDGSSADWWRQAKRDYGWWQTWFDRYQRSLFHYADQAALMNVNALIIGDPESSPAIYTHLLSNGKSSAVPEGADERMRSILREVRKRYKGMVIGVYPYPLGSSKMPEWLDSVDQIYVLLDAPLAKSAESVSVHELQTAAITLLNGDIAKIQKTYKKPVLIGVAYPSATGAALGCVPAGEACLVYRDLTPASEGITVQLQTQVDLYNAVFSAANSLDWISGIVSRGFFPPVTLQDGSSSIHGKPAADIVWYWFNEQLKPIQ